MLLCVCASKTWYFLTEAPCNLWGRIHNWWATFAFMVGFVPYYNAQHEVLWSFIHIWRYHTFMNTSSWQYDLYTYAQYNTGWVKKMSPLTKCDTIAPTLEINQIHFRHIDPDVHADIYMVQKWYWSIEKYMSYERLKTKDYFCSNTRFAH